MTLAIAVQTASYCLAGADRLWVARTDSGWMCGLKQKLFLAKKAPLAVVTTGLGSVGDDRTADVIRRFIATQTALAPRVFAEALGQALLPFTLSAAAIVEARVSEEDRANSIQDAISPDFARIFVLTQYGKPSVLRVDVAGEVKIQSVRLDGSNGDSSNEEFVLEHKSLLLGEGAGSATEHVNRVAAMMEEAIRREAIAFGCNRTIGGGIDLAIIDERGARMVLSKSIAAGLDKEAMALGRRFGRRRAFRRAKRILTRGIVDRLRLR